MEKTSYTLASFTLPLCIEAWYRNIRGGSFMAVADILTVLWCSGTVIGLHLYRKKYCQISMVVGLVLSFLVQSVHADSIRTADGISCSFDASNSPWEAQVYGERNEDDTSSTHQYNGSRDTDVVGIKLSYKFGGPKRLDCNSLYQMELRSKEAKVQALEAKVKALEAVSDIKWVN